MRWPGYVSAGQVSDQIMHVTEWFTTLLHAAGAAPPSDREIDGVNQLPWLRGQDPSSQREGYLYWMGPELYGVKWRNFKLALAVQKYLTDPVGKLPSPHIVNLIADPQEREPFNLPTCIRGPPPTSTGCSPTTRPASGASRLCPAGAPLNFIPSSEPEPGK